MIPQNLLVPLQAFGIAQDDLNQRMSYANGVMMVITGNTQDHMADGAQIITQDLQSGMDSLGITTGDLAQFLLTLDDNIKAYHATNQGQAGQESFHALRLFYFTLFIEYVKFHALNNKYRAPAVIMERLHGILKLRDPGITPEQTAQLTGQLVSFQIFDGNMYALTALNPGGTDNIHICPWIFVYNNDGNARIFMSKQDMLDYDEKYGKGFGKFVKGMFTRKNLPFTLVLAGGLGGILVVSGVLLKKRHTRKVEDEKKIMTEIESEAESAYDTESEILEDNVDE